MVCLFDSIFHTEKELKRNFDKNRIFPQSTLQKSPATLIESMIFAQRERGEGKCDSLGSFLDWLTLGIVSDTWEGFRDRHNALVDDPSFLNILNALTLGTSDTVIGAVAPNEPWSFEHFLDIIGMVPTHITDVVLDAGTRIRGGIANGLWGFDGEGIQFELMLQWIGRFTNERPLK